MSRHYEMSVEIIDYNPEHAWKIMTALEEEWCWDYKQDPTEKQPARSIYCGGRGNLCGGESEEEFAQRLAQAVWEANGAFCHVELTATYLEDLPYGVHIPDEEDYERWKSQQEDECET